MKQKLHPVMILGINEVDVKNALGDSAIEYISQEDLDIIAELLKDALAVEFGDYFWNIYSECLYNIAKNIIIPCQCVSCETVFAHAKDNNCPKCGSGNWTFGYIDE